MLTIGWGIWESLTISIFKRDTWKREVFTHSWLCLDAEGGGNGLSRSFEPRFISQDCCLWSKIQCIYSKTILRSLRIKSYLIRTVWAAWRGNIFGNSAYVKTASLVQPSRGILMTINSTYFGHFLCSECGRCRKPHSPSGIYRLLFHPCLLDRGPCVDSRRSSLFWYISWLALKNSSLEREEKLF